MAVRRVRPREVLKEVKGAETPMILSICVDRLAALVIYLWKEIISKNSDLHASSFFFKKNKASRFIQPACSPLIFFIKLQGKNHV